MPDEFIAEGDKVVALTTVRIDGEEVDGADVLTYNESGKLIAFDTLADETVPNRVFPKKGRPSTTDRGPPSRPRRRELGGVALVDAGDAREGVIAVWDHQHTHRLRPPGVLARPGVTGVPLCWKAIRMPRLLLRREGE